MWADHGLFCFLTLTVLVAVAKAGFEDVLAGFSAPELNDLLKDVDYIDYKNVPEYDYGPEQDDGADFQAINMRSEAKTQQLDNDVPTNDVPKTVAGNKGQGSVAAAAAANAMLPAYCDPPNPCPIGYTEQDGCIEDFENSSEFSRRYQATQNCICDTEHMFNCPNNGGDNQQMEANILDGIPGLAGAEEDNPFLAGQKLPVAAKKGSA